MTRVLGLLLLLLALCAALLALPVTAGGAPGRNPAFESPVPNTDEPPTPNTIEAPTTTTTPVYVRRMSAWTQCVDCSRSRTDLGCFDISTLSQPEQVADSLCLQQPPTTGQCDIVLGVCTTSTPTTTPTPTPTPAVTHRYVSIAQGGCSVTCGEGFQRYVVNCLTANNIWQAPALCTFQSTGGQTMPATVQVCSLPACPPTPTPTSTPTPTPTLPVPSPTPLEDTTPTPTLPVPSPTPLEDTTPTGAASAAPQPDTSITAAAGGGNTGGISASTDLTSSPLPTDALPFATLPLGSRLYELRFAYADFDKVDINYFVGAVEDAFVDSIPMLNAAPNRFNIVGVKRGSVIVRFVVTPLPRTGVPDSISASQLAAINSVSLDEVEAEIRSQLTDFTSLLRSNQVFDETYDIVDELTRVIRSDMTDAAVIEALNNPLLVTSLAGINSDGKPFVGTVSKHNGKVEDTDVLGIPEFTFIIICAVVVLIGAFFFYLMRRVSKISKAAEANSNSNDKGNGNGKEVDAAVALEEGNAKRGGDGDGDGDAGGGGSGAVSAADDEHKSASWKAANEGTMEKVVVVDAAINVSAAATDSGSGGSGGSGGTGGGNALLVPSGGGGGGADKRRLSRSKSANANSICYDEDGEMTMRMHVGIDFDELEINAIIGQGAFGKVYRGSYLDAPVAVKQLSTLTSLTQETVESLQREAATMASLRSPFIVSFYGISHDKVNGAYSLVMEYLPGGSLYQLLHSRRHLAWSVRYRLARDIACGVRFLHAQTPTLLHRDVKSLNVLLTRDCRARLTDFGLAQVKLETSTLSASAGGGGAVGSTLWMAPELLKPRAAFSSASDLYALGMVFYELASRALPFSLASSAALVPAWVRDGERDDVPDDCPAAFGALIEQCWSQEAKARPTAKAVADALATLMDAHPVTSSDVAAATGGDPSAAATPQSSAANSNTTSNTNTNSNNSKGKMSSYNAATNSADTVLYHEELTASKAPPVAPGYESHFDNSAYALQSKRKGDGQAAPSYYGSSGAQAAPNYNGSSGSYADTQRLLSSSNDDKAKTSTNF